MERKFKNRKLNSGIKTGLILLVSLTTMGLFSSCDTSSLKKNVKITRVECTNDGEYKESLQFLTSEKAKNNTDTNTFKYYDGWREVNGEYSQQVSVYNVEGKTYEDIKPLINNEKMILEVLGEPSWFYTETKGAISKEELERGPYFRAVMYSKEEKNKETEDSDTNYAPLFIGGGLACIGTAGLIAWKKYNDKEEKKKLILKK